jgi:peptidoglycan/xylan/chitin deacetylase (PgdA/CDA1 family)
MAFASNFISKGAQYIPLQWMRPFSGVSLVVPFYHVVSDEALPHISHLYRFRNVKEFENDLSFLLRHFQPVSLSDIVDSLNGSRALKKPSFHVTFDDGFKETFQIVAPILLRAGVPATFFLNTAFLDGGGIAHHNRLSLLIEKLKARDGGAKEATLRKLESLLPSANGNHSDYRSRLLSIRHDQSSLVASVAETLEVDFAGYVREKQPYLCSDQITKLMEMGFSIGAHSHDHPLYSNLSLSAQIQQTRTCIDFLRANFSPKFDSFAFPYNDDGVGSAFFTEVFDKSSLAVSFGTSGLISHFHPRNIQRVAIEKEDAEGNSIPITRILGRQFVRAAYFRLKQH